MQLRSDGSRSTLGRACRNRNSRCSRSGDGVEVVESADHPQLHVAQPANLRELGQVVGAAELEIENGEAFEGEQEVETVEGDRPQGQRLEVGQFGDDLEPSGVLGHVQRSQLPEPGQPVQTDPATGLADPEDIDSSGRRSSPSRFWSSYTSIWNRRNRGKSDRNLRSRMLPSYPL